MGLLFTGIVLRCRTRHLLQVADPWVLLNCVRTARESGLAPGLNDSGHSQLSPKMSPKTTDKKKGLAGPNLLTLMPTGRDGGIRTRDPLHPMQVRYQAALRPD
jgi:hypothetical protein